MYIVVADKKLIFGTSEDSVRIDIENSDTANVFLVFDKKCGDPYNGLIEYGCYETLEEAVKARSKLINHLKGNPDSASLSLMNEES